MVFSVLCGPGDDLLSHVLRQSTIGAKAFDGRVRDGIGSFVTLQEPPGRQRTVSERERTGDGRREGGLPIVARRLCSGVRIEAKLVPRGRRTDDREEKRHAPSPARSVCLFVCLSVCLSSLISRLGDESNQVERAISTGQLHTLLCFHIRPINVVVFHGSSGRTCFEAGFPLRCLQRLSIPYIATLHRRWRDDRSTRDTFTPVLSY